MEQQESSQFITAVDHQCAWYLDQVRKALNEADFDYSLALQKSIRKILSGLLLPSTNSGNTTSKSKSLYDFYDSLLTQLSCDTS